MSKKGKRKGVWSEVQTFSDPDSNLSVVVSERIRGKPEHSVQFVHHDKMGPNRYLPVPCPGAKHPFKDIMFSLAQSAEEFIAKREAEWAAKNPEGGKDDKPKSGKPKRERREHKPQGGLSTLAKRDAEAQGFTRGSQTERKRKKPGS